MAQFFSFPSLKNGSGQTVSAGFHNEMTGNIIIVSIIPGSSDKATTSQTDPPTEGNLPDIQMSQSFTDQIPDIAGGPTEASV